MTINKQRAYIIFHNTDYFGIFSTITHGSVDPV